MRRGQVSLEFMFVFAIFLTLLVYSVNNVTFTQNSQSVETLRVQVSLEAKSFANTISNTVSQVYAQGPGSKATTYFMFKYLKDESFLKKAYNMSGTPQILIGYQNGTYVGILDSSNKNIYQNETNTMKRNLFWSRALYSKNVTSYSPSASGTSLPGILVNANALPTTLKIVVEWNPDNTEAWSLDTSTGELHINIKPGG
ncbi:class III signal peptide-containing protein [Palaeococcus sp. (in: euryarchaeotes)]